MHCRDNIKIARSKKNQKQFDIIISYSDVTETIYNSLISLNNTNELYEVEDLNLDIELSSFLDFILAAIIYISFTSPS